MGSEVWGGAVMWGWCMNRDGASRSYVREFGSLEGVFAYPADVGGAYRDSACEGDAFPGGINGGRGGLPVDGGRGGVEEGAIEAGGGEWNRELVEYRRWERVSELVKDKGERVKSEKVDMERIEQESNMRAKEVDGWRDGVPTVVRCPP